MNNCWHFLGSKDRRGYGRIGGRRACRVAYESLVGPLDDRPILHRCDNPPCINPDHLYPGTPKENMQDMMARGRNRYDNHPGSDNGNALLTEDVVEWIRANYQPYIYTAEMLASKFGVKRRTIYKVLGNESWRHVKAAVK